MRPLQLTLEGFGPYPTPQVIDFERFKPFGLFLIHGPTGSGKSTVLDAITYALFDDKKVERKGADFISTLDPEAETKVTLTFEHRGRRYRVTRRPAQQRRSKRGSGLATVAADALFEDLDADTILATKTGDATEQIVTLLNMDSGQFRQTVVLPQGEFRKVITDHLTRRTVLARVFHTERFADLTERIKTKADDLLAHGKDLERQRAELLAQTTADNPTDLDDLVAAAREAQALAAAEREGAQRRRAAAETAKTDGQRLSAAFARLDALLLRQRELTLQAPTIEQDRDRFEAARRAAHVTDRRNAFERAGRAALAAARASDDARADVVKKAALLEEAGRAFEAEQGREEERAEATTAERALDALRQPLADLEATSQAVVARRRERDAAVRELAELDEAIDTIKADMRSLREEQVRLGGEIADEPALRERARKLDQTREAVDAIAQQREELRSRHEQLAALPDEGDLARRWLQDLRHNAAGIVAGELVDDAACPVCGSTHHPAPHPAADLEAVASLLEGYSLESGRLAAIRTHIERAEAAMHEVLHRQRWMPEDVPDLARLDEERAEVQRHLDGVAVARERTDQISKDRARLDAELADATERRKLLAARPATFDGEISTLEQRRHALSQRIDPELREPGALDARLALAKEHVAALTAALSDATRARSAAAADHLAAVTTAGVLATAEATAKETLRTATQEYHERLLEEGFARAGRPDPEALAAAELPPPELTQLQQVIEAFDEEMARVTASIETLSGELEGEAAPDLEALESAVIAAIDAWQRADEELSLRSQEHHRLADTRQQLVELASRHAAILERINAAKRLRDLAAGAVKGRAKVDLETFVLQSIVAEVLAVGNQHLHRMTGGRFSLHLVSDDEAAGARGLELEVSDNLSSGERRPVHTLSGGEGFLASLALALGLSESAQRNSGASDLGALFIDEGFGSLDAAALDNVVDILRRLPADGRLVGVITHVDDLKRRIPAQLLVERGDLGSSIRQRLDG